MLLVSFAGCSRKQDDKSSAGRATPPGQTGAIQGTTDIKAVTPQEKAEVRAAAAHVLKQLQAGDFPVIYREASSGFKHIGPEAAFVTKFQQVRMKTGNLVNPRESSFDVRPDKTFVLVYRAENERYATDWRLTFARGQNGKLELDGLNQHDELKKKSTK
jgi:hypothetical protein